jgi:hypothetical protein
LLWQATDALYLEVERLSAAWEEANAHVHKKVFGLKEMEEKLGKALNEVRHSLLLERVRENTNWLTFVRPYLPSRA